MPTKIVNERPLLRFVPTDPGAHAIFQKICDRSRGGGGEPKVAERFGIWNSTFGFIPMVFYRDILEIFRKLRGMSPWNLGVELCQRIIAYFMLWWISAGTTDRNWKLFHFSNILIWLYSYVHLSMVDPGDGASTFFFGKSTHATDTSFATCYRSSA